MSLKDKFEKIFTKSLFKSILEIISIFVCILFALLLFAIFICIVSNTLVIVPKERIGESIGLIISSVIATGGVVAGFYFNKKQTYKEIVTRERIKWLHKIQEDLSEYLKITSSEVVCGNNKILATKLYYQLIFNINHDKDVVALNLLKNYHKAVLGQSDKIKVYLDLKDEVKIELVLDKGKEDELIFKIRNKSELEKLEEIIKLEELEKINLGKENEKSEEKEELKKEVNLLRQEISKEFTKIFNQTWRDIKGEAF